MAIKSTTGEGSECTCPGGETGHVHHNMLLRIDESFKQDSERRRTSPTTETMRASVLAHRNGHT